MTAFKLVVSWYVQIDHVSVQLETVENLCTGQPRQFHQIQDRVGCTASLLD